MGIFRINPHWRMRHIFSIPQSKLLPTLPHFFSGTPSSPKLLHAGGGDSFEVEQWGRLLCDAASSIVPTECTVPCLCRLSCGQEAAQREGTKVWSLQNVCFKSHFTHFPPFFFFKGKKKALFVFVLFCFRWWINNTKRSLVKGENQRAGGLWIPRYLDFLQEEREKDEVCQQGPYFFS